MIEEQQQLKNLLNRIIDRNTEGGFKGTVSKLQVMCKRAYCFLS